MVAGFTVADPRVYDRAGGAEQFSASARREHTMTDQAVMEAKAPAKSGAQPQYEVVVIGAGVGGIYQIKRLADLGINATVLDTSPDLGGTWYWNRYSGARFDSESYTYGYSWSQRAARPVALGGTVLAASRRTLKLPQLRGRQVRPPPPHAASTAPVKAMKLRRGRQPGGGCTSSWATEQRHDHPVRGHRPRHPVDRPPTPSIEGMDRFPGPVVPHLRLAGRSRWNWPASGWP